MLGRQEEKGTTEYEMVGWHHRPIMMTMAPPVVQPSLGLMALMHGVAKKIGKKKSSLSFGG